MNINALRLKTKVQHDTAFSVTLSWLNDDAEDITVTGAQQGVYTTADAMNYGSLIDNPNRTVLLLPCWECVDSDGAEVVVETDCRATRLDTGEMFVVNAVDKTLKGSWWRCVVTKEGR